MTKIYTEAYRNRKEHFAAALLILLVLFTPAYSTASDPFAGKIISIENRSGQETVNILRLGKNGYDQAKRGDAVFISDTIKTGPGVKVQIQLSDTSIVNIGPNATFAVKAYIISPSEGKRNYVFKALKGTIRFIISKTFHAIATGAVSNWKDSTVVVETPTAIAGVKGTDFFVMIDTSKPVPVVDIAVMEGVVTVRNSSLSIRDAITLSANQVTTVLRGMKPKTPSLLTPERRSTLTNLTTPSPSKTPANGGPAQGAQTEPGEEFTSADIARELAAGVPVAEVLDQAAMAGLSVSEMVTAALSVGVEPGGLVYIAVTEGYPAEAVVASAISQGAPLNQVIAAAVIAGADTSVIIEVAGSIGVPASMVATALATATTSPSPVYGDSTPVTTSPATATIVPPPLITVSGGGGETPSTLPASGYKPSWRR